MKKVTVLMMWSLSFYSAKRGGKVGPTTMHLPLLSAATMASAVMVVVVVVVAATDAVIKYGCWWGVCRAAT